MSGHQKQTQKPLTELSEADAIIRQLAKKARNAQAALGRAEAKSRNLALLQAAQLIRQNNQHIETANKKDRDNGQQMGLTDAFIDRLTLTTDRIESMATGLEDIAGLDDPLGVELARWTRPNGLDIARISTALGVIGVIYESRPNVTVDAAGLCIKSGNAVILRGGSDSYHTSQLLSDLMQQR